ncbi:hypothetical protein CRE_23420 [Caenorhabditis remanei]|uniref:F-box domain-containing protein n=1 Tax=Caenorhabditis remanei TaxID=31234 RepID=E3MGP8_CAERE|nr:hypothetical protein CRE_23420 [Caenorhabditis remanei]
MSPSFLEIPDIPMEMIMNNLDYIAIQSVRKTCWGLRNFIDDNKLRIGIKRIGINHISDTAVGLKISTTIFEHPAGKYIDLTYEKHENGCKILGGTSNGWKNNIVANLNFLDAVFHDFKVALNTQKSPFELITTTERMEIRGEPLEHVRQIIQNADPKHLKSIGIYPPEPDIIIRETVKCESSKNPQNFSHFSIISIQLDNLDVETLRAIKEVCLFVQMSIYINFFQNFLQFHEYDKHLYVSNNVVENMFIDAFGTTLKPDEEWDENGEELDVNWFFSVPENEEKVLTVLKRHDCFEFSFIKKCYVPEGYVIRD